jgi:hypothetical protein
LSLLTIIQDACNHPSLTLPVVASVVGNSSSHAPALLMAAKEELDSLATRHGWQKLTKEHTFTTTASAVQLTASAFPTDFDRMVNESMFNRTTRRHIFGPLDSVEWQTIQATVSTMVDPAYRIRGGTILISPTPATGNTIAYEYISTYKVRALAGDEKVTWSVDSDTTIFPESIVTLGVVWRYRRGRGFNFSAEQEEYERRVADAISRDGTKRRLLTDAPYRVRQPHPPQTPETLTGLS